jgi:hypothetical protein
MMFGLVSGFVAHFQFVSTCDYNSSQFETVYNLLRHTLILLCHYQSYGNGFQTALHEVDVNEKAGFRLFKVTEFVFPLVGIENRLNGKIVEGYF